MYRLPLSCLLLLAGCADEGPEPARGPNACTVAQEVLAETLTMLRAEAPRCEADAECVEVATDLETRGARLRLCGDVLHREAAARWDPEALRDTVDARAPSSALHCSVEASCTATRPACRAGACVGVEN